MSSREPVLDGAQASARPRGVAVGALLLVLALSALLFYNWGGSLRAVRRAVDSGALGISPDAIVDGGILVTTLNYFQRIWPALAYGVLIGAIVRSMISPEWIASLLGRRGAKPTLAGAACGSPLMLCSCCVTPVFTSVYERGARLGPALSLMLASPGLNLAALALTFILMPLEFGFLRLAAALLVVLALAPAIGRLHETSVRAVAKPAADAEPPVTLRGVAVRFARSLAYMTLVTVPLIVVGVLLSAWLLPHAVHFSSRGTAIAIVVVALTATVVALPTFFEIPIAFLLLELGAPGGAAVALLIAGPMVNLPSLLVLARETNAKVAVSLAFGVWALASMAGLAASFG